MKKLFILCGLLLNICIYAAPPTQISNHLTLAPMLRNVMPAVVNISVRGQLPPIILPYEKLPKELQPEPESPLAPRPDIKITPRFEGVGSGVIIDAENGYILTNAHVVKDAKVIIVTLNDGRRLQGKTLGADKQLDIAVIQVKAKHLNAIEFGDSDSLKVGDYVAAIGNPFGLSQTVTSGVISGLERSQLGIEGYENFIQTDAPINPGNSGGALVNMQGELVGINTAIVTPYSVGGSVGIGLAIPSNMAKSVMQQIIKYGKVEHSLIGVIVQNITPALADAFNINKTTGALISDVSPGFPAARAGIKDKDIIIKLNGKPVQNAFQVSNTIGLLRPGTRVTLEILRNARTKTIHMVTVSAKEAKAIQDQMQKPLLVGLALRDFNQLENNEQITGVQVLDVDEFSLAYSAGLRPGDVILSANNKSISNIDQLKHVAAKQTDSMLLKVKRMGGGNIFMVLER